MAWRSSGSTHKEMVDCLRKNELIQTDVIEKGLRAVDRALFVPPGSKELAYSDQPLKEGKIHISAPHIYCTVLEALQLEENSSLSFLNIGSGTGYLSCIVAEILGPRSLNYGVELFEDAVNHSKQSIESWRKIRNERNNNAPFLHLDIIHGNIFEISTSEGESLIGFDRIYVGAALSRNQIAKISQLLSPGGILVGPVDDELLKVIRTGSGSGSGLGSSSVKTVSFRNNNDEAYDDEAYDDDDDDDDDNDNIILLGSDFLQQVISNVRFAPLVTTPNIKTVIPARIWSPNTQQYFPDTFKKAVNQIFFYSNSSIIQPHPPLKKIEDRINVAATLPKVLWMEIFSFTHRKWFDTEQSKAADTKKRLLEEQSNVAKANAARLDAERRCHMAERERDMYRLLARRWQSRLNIVLQQQYSLNSQNLNSNHSSTNRLNNMLQMENILNALGQEQIIISTLDSLSNNDMEEDEGHFFSMQFANRAIDNNINDNSMDDGNESDDNSDTQNYVQENNQNENNQSIQMMNDDTNLNQDDQFDQDDEDDNNSFHSDSTQFSLDNNQQDNQHNADENNFINNDSIIMEDINDNISLSSTLSSASKQNSGMDIEIRNKQIRTVSMGSTDL